MVKAFPEQTALNGGELSPRLHARPDLAKYQTSLATCANFIPRVQGGLTRRPGTRFVAEVKDSTASQLLVPFVFSRTQAYMLEFGDQYVRFYMRGGQLYATSPNYELQAEDDTVMETEDGQTINVTQVDPSAAPYELSSPYTEDELSDIQYAQTADVMFITHPDHPIRTLTRTGHTQWTFAEYEAKNGPFLELNDDEAHTIRASAVTGTVTLTSSKAFFDSGMVGALMYLEQGDEEDYSAWEPGINFSLGDQVRWLENVYQADIDSGDSGAVAPVHLDGSRWDGRTNGSVRWKYLHSGFGTVRITAVASSTSATATVIKRLPENVVSDGTDKWKEGAFSNYRGYPRAVALYEQRLWFASTDYRPQTLWSSVAGDFFDFDDTDLPDNAITYTVNSRNANPIEALSDSLFLHVFAQDREMIGAPSNNSAGVAQGDFSVKPSTSYGSSPVIPVTIDASTLFVDESGFRLVELSYALENDGFAPIDLTLFADHIARPGQ